MPAYLDRARALAELLRDVPGVTVLPDPPQTPMLHLLLRTSPESFVSGARRLTEQGLWTWPRAMTTGDPDVQRVELSVGDGTLALSLTEARDAVAVLVGGARVAS
jgi:hypothetical protein